MNLALQLGYLALLLLGEGAPPRVIERHAVVDHLGHRGQAGALQIGGRL
jgi:hypothetical protein